MTRPILTITAALVLVLIGFGSAAPRPASDSLPGVDQPRTGAPLGSMPSQPDRQTVRPDSTRTGGAPDSGGPTIGPMPPPAVAVRGVASWYATSGPGLYAAAGPGLRTGHWRGRTVSVSANGHTVVVRLVDWCACRGKLIDLSADAFSRLAPLSRGLVRVVVQTVGPQATPPATDT